MPDRSNIPDSPMRIALAQLDPIERRHRRQHRKVLDAIDGRHSARGGPARHAGDGAPGLLHRRSGRGRGLPRRQRARDAAHRRRRAAASPPSSASSITTARRTNDNGTHPQAQRRGRCLATARPAARAQVAAAQLSLLRRQALLHARASRATPVDVRARLAARVRLGVSICEDMWDAFYAVKPLPELAAKGAERARSTSTPRRSTPASASERDAHHPPAHRAAANARSSTSTPSAPPTTARTSSRSTARASSTTRDGRLLAIGPAVRRGAADRRRTDLPDARRRRRLRAAASVDREREIYDALRHGAARLHAQDRLHATPSCRCRAASIRRWRSRLPPTRSGPDRVSAFNMPSQFNTETTRGRSPRELAQRARRALWRHPDPRASPTRSSAVFEPHAHPIARGFTRENLQARIRGLLMMAESNDTGALLISCGNETEIALGYATLYGDMCGGISLIGDLSKTDVYRLARYVNARHGAEKIPEEAFTIVPSAELADGSVRSLRLRGRRAPRRRDGRAPPQRRRAPRALRTPRARSGDASCPTPTAGPSTTSTRAPRSRPCSTTAAGRIRRSVYKRLQGPPIVIVSERAFGFDLRETIINGWTG